MAKGKTSKNQISEASAIAPEKYGEKKKSRILALQRTILMANEAADAAEEDGDAETAAALRERAEALQGLIDTQQREDELNLDDIDDPDEDEDEKERMSVDDLIRRLKPLQGEDREDAQRALRDLLSGLSEALKRMPDKMLMELTDDEFDDLINDTLNEIDRITKIEFSDEADRKAKLDRIKIMQDNADIIGQDLDSEDQANKLKDRRKILSRDREKEKYANLRPLSQFEPDLWKTIKDQVTAYEEQEDSYLYPNARYSDSDIIMPGTRRIDKKKEEKPSLDFYFDMSGSWVNDKEAVEMGKKIVKSVLEFEERGQLTVNLFYFSNKVVTNIHDPSLGYGTFAWEPIVQSIKATGAKNVVLMTDDDMESTMGDNPPSCRVDGCVWFIWRHGEYSPKVVSHLRGAQGSLSYKF